MTTNKALVGDVLTTAAQVNYLDHGSVVLGKHGTVARIVSTLIAGYRRGVAAGVRARRRSGNDMGARASGERTSC